MYKLDLAIFDGDNHTHVVDTFGPFGRPEKEQVALGNVPKLNAFSLLGHVI